MSPENRKGNIRLGQTPLAPTMLDQQVPEWAALLDGDLKDKPIAYLLKVAQHYELTGRMYVGSAACNVTIQFGLGRAVHATSPFCSGLEALIDLFIWKTGRIRFEPGQQPDKVSVQESLEELLFRGQSYSENLSFLEQLAINEMSFLMRPPGRLAEGEFEQRLAKGQRVDRGMQSEFYSNTYGTRNIKDTAEKLGLSQSQWVAIVANLLQLGLLLTPDGRNVQFAEPGFLPGVEDNVLTALSVIEGAGAQVSQERKTEEELGPDPVTVGVPNFIVPLDPNCIGAVAVHLTDPQTGILSFDAFQFFLCQEFARAFRFRSTFSLALFCVRLADRPNQALPKQAGALLLGTINQLKQDADLVGHFGACSFGLLLPGVDGEQAGLVVERINNEVLKRQPTLAQYQPYLHFGIATVPFDATNLATLVEAAQSAMQVAAARNMVKVHANQVGQLSQVAS